MNRIFALIFRFSKPIFFFFSCFPGSHVVDQVRLELHNGVIFPVHVFGRNMLTANDQINTHSRINASDPINAPSHPPATPRCELCIRRSPRINAPRLMDAHPRIASKPKETLYRVKSRNLFRFFLAWLTMTCELHLVQFPQLWGICAHCQISPGKSGPYIDTELWTTSLGFALAQIRLVSYLQTLFSILLREQTKVLLV